MKRILALSIGVLQCLLCAPSLMADGVVWTFPETISTANQNASNPCVGLDVNGNAVALWIENGVVRASTMPVNGDWTASVAISGASASAPQLVVDVNGNATAIWVQSGLISTATLPFNGSWSGVATLSAAASSAPQIAVDTSGNVVAIWVTNGVIESATQLFNQSWQATPDILSSTGMDSPQVAIGANGNVVAVWHNAVSTPSAVLSAQKLLSGSWSAAQTISSASYNCAYPKIAVDPNGNAAAIWFRYQVSNMNYSNVGLQAALCPYNASWASAADLSGSGYYNPANLVSKVQYDGNGGAAAIWNTSLDGSTFFDKLAILSPSGTWITGLDLLGQDPEALAFDLATDQSGNAFAVYMTKDPTTANVNINYRKIGLDAFRPGWSGSYITLSQGAYNGFPRAVGSAVGTQFYSAAVWLNSNGTNTTVVAAKGTGIGISPPTGLAVVQGVTNYFLFQNYYNTLTWQASASPSVRGYFVIRNGRLINNVSSTAALQVVDGNRIAGVSDTYTVIAYSNDFSESQPVQISYP